MEVNPPLYAVHTVKKEWGIGVLTEQSDGHFRYRFENGDTKTFAEHTLNFLSEVNLTEAEAKSLKVVKASKSSSGSSSSVSLPSFSTWEQQVERFLLQYPDGFQDDAFVTEQRGVKGGRKAFRQALIDLAHSLIDKEGLRQNLLVKSGAGTLTMCKKLIVKGKPLLSTQEWTDFQAMAKNVATEQTFAEALIDWLFGEGDLAERFNRWVEAWDPSCRTWPMITLFAAAVSPQDHVVVDPKIFAKQAVLLQLPAKYEDSPDADSYLLGIEMAKVMSQKLTESDLSPRDLMDVSAFMACTWMGKTKTVRKRKA
jgi:hypothetical protein